MDFSWANYNGFGLLLFLSGVNPNIFLVYFGSEFSDIFDLEHFKRILAHDVRVVNSLPSTHLMSRPVEEKRTPLHVSPRWIRSRYLKRVSLSLITWVKMADILILWYLNWFWISITKNQRRLKKIENTWLLSQNMSSPKCWSNLRYCWRMIL